MPDLFPHLPPGATPSYDDLVQAMRDLHEVQQNIKVSDLPIKQLQDKLEQSWQPAASALLAAASIGPNLLSFDVVTLDADHQGLVLGPLHVRWGTTTVTYPGGSVSTGDTTVTHGCGATPLSVFTQAYGLNDYTRPFTFGSTTFAVRGRRLDGGMPVAGSVVDVAWAAITWT